jgi:hypothetical protein
METQVGSFLASLAVRAARIDPMVTLSITANAFDAMDAT